MDILIKIWRVAQDFFIEYSWTLDGFTSALVFYIVFRVLHYGFREHRYLYNLEDSDQTIETWVKFVRPLARRVTWVPYHEWIKLKKSQAAFKPAWDTFDFIAYQLVLTGLVGLLAYLSLTMLLGLPFSIAVAAAASAYFYPLISIHDVAAKRQTSCYRDLPFFIDYLCLAMGAGLDFNQSLQSVLGDAPKSPLADEFAVAMKNMRLGLSRAEALHAMDQRLENPSLKLFLHTLIQAMELGTDVTQTLTALSDTFRTKRFQFAEEQAGKISVRMMIPMLFFVLPAVMIMLLGPMILTSPLDF